MEQALTLLELNTLVQQTLSGSLSDEYWVQAELSDVRIHGTGHCYLELVQKSAQGNQLVAKARGTIWASTFQTLRPLFEQATGQAFVSGIGVLAKVRIQFHPLYGYSLNVLAVDPTYTLGDLARRRREILRRLEIEGVLTLNKELTLPLLPQRIAVVSSATAAGYGDFAHQLADNSRGYAFHTELFEAAMQGEKTERTILAALERIYDRQSEFDVVVIIRGGGATSDLTGFDTYLLAAACAQFPLPILTGIGHERDDTLLDAVAHTRVKTPTAAAEFLLERMDEAAAALQALTLRLHQSIRTRLAEEQRKLTAYRARVPSAVMRRLAGARLSLQRLEQALSGGLRTAISLHRHRLELLEQRLVDASPEKMLARGYSLTLRQGKVVKKAGELQAGTVIETVLAEGRIKSVVQERNTADIS
jgi:exodeoxyribonuclease VII large subunit